MTAADILRRAEAAAKRESLELALLQQIKAAKLTGGMVRQHAPFADVGYAFDFAWPALDPVILIEVQGGIWSGGAHARGAGITRDIVKHNRAALGGYLLIQATGEHVKSGQALAWIRQAMGQEA